MRPLSTLLLALVTLLLTIVPSFAIPKDKMKDSVIQNIRATDLINRLPETLSPATAKAVRKIRTIVTADPFSLMVAPKKAEGPGLNAGGNDIAMEELVLMVEQIELTMTPDELDAAYAGMAEAWSELAKAAKSDKAINKTLKDSISGMADYWTTLLEDDSDTHHAPPRDERLSNRKS